VLLFHQVIISPVFFVLRLRSGDESKARNTGFLLFPFLSLCFQSSLSRYPWFVPFCSSLCFVLWSLSIYSLSIPLFIFLRSCSLRRNKENNLAFWFILCPRFLPFVAFSSPFQSNSPLSCWLWFQGKIWCDTRKTFVTSKLPKYISYHTKKSKSITSLEALRGLRPRKTVSIPVIDAVSITSLKKSVIALGRIFQSFPR